MPHHYRRFIFFRFSSHFLQADGASDYFQLSAMTSSSYARARLSSNGMAIVILSRAVVVDYASAFHHRKRIVSLASVPYISIVNRWPPTAEGERESMISTTSSATASHDGRRPSFKKREAR